MDSKKASYDAGVTKDQIERKLLIRHKLLDSFLLLWVMKVLL